MLCQGNTTTSIGYSYPNHLCTEVLEEMDVEVQVFVIVSELRNGFIIHPPSGF